jgi:hypothetical protein
MQYLDEAALGRAIDWDFIEPVKCDKHVKRAGAAVRPDLLRNVCRQFARHVHT